MQIHEVFAQIVNEQFLSKKLVYCTINYSLFIAEEKNALKGESRPLSDRTIPYKRPCN